MKEKEFMKRLNYLNYGDNIKIPVFWSLDDDDNVFIDFDSMREEWDFAIKEIEELIREKDELTKIVKEKIGDIKNKNE